MAARAVNMVGSRGSSSSSSEDDEELRRCQEAVWDARSHEATKKSSDGDSSVQPSKRVVVAEHEHDGNELQVTQGFRTHVAKKLGTFLDSCITEMQTAASSCVESNCDDEDEGFRLFSTSVPGQTADEPPAPVKRRTVSSSSDSDSEMEMRLKEAAVSITDLLPSTPAAELPCTEKPKKKKLAEGEESQVVKKKKKKRKQSKEEGDPAGSPLSPRSNGEIESAEQEQERVKVKLKKKKKKKREEEETLN